MSAPVLWPSTLPAAPRREGYAERLGSTVIRSEMDTGPAKVRRRSTKRVDRLTLTVVLTSDQATTLLYFWDTTLAGGSLPFSWGHPRTGEPAQLRFVSQPTIDLVGRKWVAKLELEVVG